MPGPVPFPAPPQAASLGRVVIAHGLHPETNNGSTVAPAVITRVWTELEPGIHVVNAKVNLDAVGDRWVTSAYLFDEDHVDPAAWIEARLSITSERYVYLTWPQR